jgi:hypothetical protein
MLKKKKQAGEAQAGDLAVTHCKAQASHYL